MPSAIVQGDPPCRCVVAPDNGRPLILRTERTAILGRFRCSQPPLVVLLQYRTYVSE